MVPIIISSTMQRSTKCLVFIIFCSCVVTVSALIVLVYCTYHLVARSSGLINVHDNVVARINNVTLTTDWLMTQSSALQPTTVSTFIDLLTQKSEECQTSTPGQRRNLAQNVTGSCSMCCIR